MYVCLRHVVPTYAYLHVQIATMHHLQTSPGSLRQEGSILQQSLEPMISFHTCLLVFGSLHNDGHILTFGKRRFIYNILMSSRQRIPPQLVNTGPHSVATVKVVGTRQLVLKFNVNLYFSRVSLLSTLFLPVRSIRYTSRVI